jgi:hypothetical protein
MEEQECKDASICRGGCCRVFLDREFCEVESNCLDHPTWIIALVPGFLGLAAIVLIIIVLVKINRRKVIDNFEHIKTQSERQSQTTYMHRL